MRRIVGMLIVKTNFISLLLLSTCCYLWIGRISRVIADVYRRTKWLSISYNKDIKVARCIIFPSNIDIAAYCCYLWSSRIASTVTQVYWCTKTCTVIGAYCKKDIKIARSVILPCNINIVAYCCYLWNFRIASTVTQVYWCTKTCTIIGAYCKEDIIIASRSVILPCNVDIAAYCCYLWIGRISRYCYSGLLEYQNLYRYWCLLQKRYHYCQEFHLAM